MGRLTLNDLNLTEKDFKIEIVGYGEPQYSPLTFTPRRSIKVKVNGILFEFNYNANMELAQDLQALSNVNAIAYVEEVLKLEAINCYINNIQYVRKTKLERIKLNEKI